MPILYQVYHHNFVVRTRKMKSNTNQVRRAGLSRDYDNKVANLYMQLVLFVDMYGGYDFDEHVRLILL